MNASWADDLDLVADLGAEDGLHALVVNMRAAYASAAPPEAGARLAAVLARGLAAGAGVDEHRAASATPAGLPSPRRPRAASLGRRRVRLGLGALVGLSVLGTGAAGALPGPVQSAFERAAGVVTRVLPDTPSPSPADAPVEIDPTPGSGPPGPNAGADHPDTRQTDAPLEPGPIGKPATHGQGLNAADERPAEASLRPTPGPEIGPGPGPAQPHNPAGPVELGRPGRPSPGRLPEVGGDDRTGEGQRGAGPGGGGRPDSAAEAPRPGPLPGAAEGPPSPAGPGPAGPAGARQPR